MAPAGASGRRGGERIKLSRCHALHFKSCEWHGWLRVCRSANGLIAHPAAGEECAARMSRGHECACPCTRTCSLEHTLLRAARSAVGFVIGVTLFNFSLCRNPRLSFVWYRLTARLRGPPCVDETTLFCKVKEPNPCARATWFSLTEFAQGLPLDYKIACSLTGAWRSMIYT